MYSLRRPVGIGLRLLASGILAAIAGVPIFSAPTFIGPAVRAADGYGTTLAVPVRGYQGELVRLRAGAKSAPAEAVATPMPRAGDTLLTVDAPEWPVAVSVDGGAKWLDETPQGLPDQVELALATDTGTALTAPVVYLLWYLPQNPVVRRWRFQYAVPDYTNASTPLTWLDYNIEPNVSLYCESIIRKTVPTWRCLRPIPQTQLLWRVAGQNDSILAGPDGIVGQGGYGSNVYMVGMWMATAPATGQLPCWFPNPNGPCP